MMRVVYTRMLVVSALQRRDADIRSLAPCRVACLAHGDACAMTERLRPRQHGTRLEPALSAPWMSLPGCVEKRRDAGGMSGGVAGAPRPIRR